MTAAPLGARLVVDAARCDGHGICVLRCPELVSLDRFGFAAVDGAVIAAAAVLRRARRAVAACPEGALAIVEAGRTAGSSSGAAADTRPGWANGDGRAVGVSPLRMIHGAES
ncbi:MAG: ferredoxin [Actinomycetota bacterium]|nr:ferredoxin [Actinomycetota bacterium]